MMQCLKRLKKTPPPCWSRHRCGSRRKLRLGDAGTKSRSGRSTRPGFEGGQMPLYRRLPKLKHFTVINPKHYTTINVGKLASLPADTEVTLTSLIDVGLITSKKGPLKILGDGELSVPLSVNAAAFTTGARTKIEAAGGRCEFTEG